MLLALARETPEVLPQLGISMAMLQKEQEDLQNVEQLKVGSLKSPEWVQRRNDWGKVLGGKTITCLNLPVSANCSSSLAQYLLLDA